MSRISHTITLVVITVIALLALFPNPLTAQQKRAPYGPVVKAYLTGLYEELNELEYQLRHQEISRAEYDLAKNRLTILRRFVERHASERREDSVPEYQVLTENELSTLGPGREFKRDELFAGAMLEGEWKIVGFHFGGARNLTRFIVLERQQRSEITNGAGIVREGKLGKTIDPRDVIETIVIPEKTPRSAAPQSTVPSEDQTAPGLDQSAAIQTIVPIAQKPRLQSPRILHLYMPEYTEKARDKKIEGDVIVRALFGADGKIRNTKVEKGLGFGLDDRAVEASKRIGYFPAQLDGKEVDAQVQIVFSFKMGKVSVYIGAAEPKSEGQ